MKVAVKHSVPVWVEVDLKTKTVDRVTIDSQEVSRPIEYRVVLPNGMYDTTRYPGRKMAKAARAVTEKAKWPEWENGF